MKQMRVDGRRLAGDRTRSLLLETTKSLIAKHGEAGFSLRDITDAAETNIAAVSYHFGSKENLCRVAIESAIDQVASQHLRAVTALPASAGVDQIVETLVTGIVSRKGSTDEDERALLSVSARALLAGVDQASATAVSRELTEQLFKRLRTAMPQLRSDELRFRLDAAVSIMHVASTGGFDAHTAGLKRAKLIRWLVSAVSGTLNGSPQTIS